MPDAQFTEYAPPRYMYSIQVELDIPNAPGERCSKHMTKRVVAVDVESACTVVRASLPTAVKTQFMYENRLVQGPDREVRGVKIISCSMIHGVDLTEN